MIVSTDCLSSYLFRSFPDHEYNVLQFAHQGPFSKTVTMTHPLNPFNKVEHHMHYC